MKLHRLVVVGLALLASFGTSPSRADEAADAAYAAALGDYKQQIRAIETLYSEYQTADTSRQNAINEELKPLVAAAKTKVEAMVDSALEVFKAAPLADQQVTDLLVSVVQQHIVGANGNGGDQYEKALPILEALVDAKHEKPELAMWGVMAAVCANEFDLADKFAKIAIETGAVGAAPSGSDEEVEVFGQAQRYVQDKDRFRARWEREKPIREAEAAADNLPRVKMTLDKGEVVIELFEDQAPIATANFLSLVKKGFYDGVVFHRVLPRFMAQGGDPTGTGSGGPGYSIACECEKPEHRQHFRGTMSMAHAGKDTGGSQFFLCFVPTDFLDGRHTAFGRVVEGIEIIGDIQKIDPQGRGGPKPDKIVKAEVIRDRGHGYEYKKLPGR